MTDTTPQCRELHEEYVRMTRLDIPFSFRRICSWEIFISKGWTLSDLAMVIAHLNRKIKLRQKWGSCLSFSNLVDRTDDFEEQLAEARSLARAPKPHPAHRELTATGRPAIVEKDTTRSAAQILAGEEALKKLIALKNSL